MKLFALGVVFLCLTPACHSSDELRHRPTKSVLRNVKLILPAECRKALNKTLNRDWPLKNDEAKCRAMSRSAWRTNKQLNQIQNIYV